MISIKITPLDDRGWYNIAIIGIGEGGKAELYKLAYPIYMYHNDSCLGNVFLCDDNSIVGDFDIHYDGVLANAHNRDMVEAEIKNTEWLFTLVDITGSSDIENACNIVDLFKNGKREFKHSVCVCCSEQDEKSLTILKDKYNNLVYCNNKALLNQVPILFADMCRRGWIGIDFVDVFAFLSKTSSGFYYRFELSNMTEIDKKIEAWVSKIKSENIKINDEVNAVVHINMTPTTSMEDIDEITTKIFEVIKGDITCNVTINEDETNEKLYVSMIYGRCDIQ